MRIEKRWALVAVGALGMAACSNDAGSGEGSLASSTTTATSVPVLEFHDMTVVVEWTGQMSLHMSVAGPQRPSGVTTASADACSTDSGAESQHWDAAVAGTYTISVGSRGCASGDFTVTITVDGEVLDAVSGMVADEEDVWQHRFECCDT